MLHSVLEQAMPINPRSVLRPEYLDHTHSGFISYVHRHRTSAMNRINTNTAPVYISSSEERKASRSRRRQSHPYLRHAQHIVSRSLLQSCESSSSFNSCSTSQQRPKVTSLMPLRLSLAECATSNESLSPGQLSTNSVDCCPMSYHNGNKVAYTQSQKHVFQRPTDEFSQSTPSQSKGTSNTGGQAEQLRRSRETNTFALIDTQLSRSPLSQIRDMYLQHRNGSSSNASAGSVARTTKKANLSVVHAAVRFRIKEYLLGLQDHLKKLIDDLFNNTNSDYDIRMRDSLASQRFSLPRVPCSLRCQFCADLYSHMYSSEGTNNRPTYLAQRETNRLCSVSSGKTIKRHSTNLSPTTFPCRHAYVRTTHDTVSTTDASDIHHLNSNNRTDNHDDYTSASSTRSSSDEIPLLSVSNSPDNNSTLVNLMTKYTSNELSVDSFSTNVSDHFRGTRNCSQEVMDDIKLSPSRSELPWFDTALDKSLLSFHDIEPFVKSHRRTRLDSATFRLTSDFDHSDWSAEHLDLGPCGEEFVDLQSIVADSNSAVSMDALSLKLEEHFDSPYDSLHPFSLDFSH